MMLKIKFTQTDLKNRLRILKAMDARLTWRLREMETGLPGDAVRRLRTWLRRPVSR